MSKSQVDSVALIAAALAATLALTLLLGPFAWMASFVGLILLLVLFGFDQEGYRTILGSLGFSAVCGLCVALAGGAVFKLLAEHGEVHLADGRWITEGLPLACVFATAVLWAIDRSRMSSRVSAAERLAARPGVQQSFIRYAEPIAAPVPPPAVPPPASVAEPFVVPVPPVATSIPEPRNTYSQETVPQQPVYAPQPPVAAPPTTATPPQSMLIPTISETAHPAPAPILPRSGPPKSGKETLIYVNLIGEGLNVMRSVRAESVGRDYYEIIDTMPEGENWQFQPGQIVKCKKQTLSSGKALVAIEEAPRA